MSDNLMEKVSAFGELLRIGGAEVGRKVSAGMTSVSFKVKELFQVPSQADKIVEEATADTMEEPDWATILEICDMINHDQISSVELIRGIKKRIVLNSPRVQLLALVLLETLVKNCEKAFSEVAAEGLLDEMVKLIHDTQTVVNVRNKVLMLIEAWGKSSNELHYLPVYEETYKSLKSRYIEFPGQDDESLAPIFTPPRSVSATVLDADCDQQVHYDFPVQTFSAEQTMQAFEVAQNSIELLTTVLSSSPQQDALNDELAPALVQQCRQAQYTVQRIIETVGDNEDLLFEALNVNDELQKVLSTYEDMKKPALLQQEPEPAMIPVAAEHEGSPRFGKEDALMEKPMSSPAGAKGGNNNEMMDDLDEMIIGKKAGGTSEAGQDTNKQQKPKDDIITF
ncbi:hypothetical protein NMG60_11017856 [Bertholletia excelsa]